MRANVLYSITNIIFHVRKLTKKTDGILHGAQMALSLIKNLKAPMK